MSRKIFSFSCCDSKCLYVDDLKLRLLRLNFPYYFHVRKSVLHPCFVHLTKSCSSAYLSLLSTLKECVTALFIDLNGKKMADQATKMSAAEICATLEDFDGFEPEE